MPTTLNTRERDRLLASALSRMAEPDLRAGLERLVSRTDLPRVVVNAANALRRRRSLSEAVDRPPYRAVLPFLAASAAEPCLSETVEELGGASDDPTHEQLRTALETVRSSFPDSTIAVMLASVATEDMPASTVCLDILRTDERYGMVGWWSHGVPGEDRVTGEDRVSSDDVAQAPQKTGATTGSGAEGHDEGAGADLTGSPTPDGHEVVPEAQRAARRQRRKTAADERRRRQDAARRAAEELRRKRRQDRSQQPRRPPAGPAPLSTTDERRPPGRRPAPTLFRPPRLSASELRAFDPGDPLVGSVVYLFVPFADAVDLADEEGRREATDDGGSPLPEGAAGGGSREASEEGVAGADPPAPGAREPVDEDDANASDGSQSANEATGESGAEPQPEGKTRPCVVVGVAPGELLVRPGYSAGGRKSRDWTSVELRDWRKAGLDQPTWIGAETVRLPRPELAAPPRRLSVDDWNALW